MLSESSITNSISSNLLILKLVLEPDWNLIFRLTDNGVNLLQGFISSVIVLVVEGTGETISQLYFTTEIAVGVQ